MRLLHTIAIAGTLAFHSALAAQDGLTAYKTAAARASTPVATISYGSDPQQVADLRLPTGRGPFPVAVVIHGGCWLASMDDRTGIAGFADALGKRGFATWTIEYRRIGDPGGGWPGTFEDIAAAIDRLATVAPLYRLDLTKVVLVGHSSGAHLALWAASRPKLPAPWSSAKVRPISVVAIDGPSALAPFAGTDAKACGKPVVAMLMGGTASEKPRDYALASPAQHLPLGLHQLSVAAAFKGFVDPYVVTARRSGDQVDALDLPDANHFSIVTPGTADGDRVADLIAAKALVSVPAARSKR